MYILVIWIYYDIQSKFVVLKGWSELFCKKTVSFCVEWALLEGFLPLFPLLPTHFLCVDSSNAIYTVP